MLLQNPVWGWTACCTLSALLLLLLLLCAGHVLSAAAEPLLLHIGEQGALMQVLDQSTKGQIWRPPLSWLLCLPCLPAFLNQQSQSLCRPPCTLLLLLPLLLVPGDVLLLPAGTLGRRPSESESKTVAAFSTAADTQALIASVVIRLAASASDMPICTNTCCCRARASATKAGTTPLPGPTATSNPSLFALLARLVSGLMLAAGAGEA
jgi:hypothetical protein